MNYFQKHLGDIAKKTAHLTALEYGVYNLILDAYYDREMGPTLVEATRWARARTEEEKSAVLAVLDEFFTLGEDGRHTQKRVVEEIAAYKAKAEIAQTNGRKGGRPAKNNQDKPSGLSVGSVSVPENNQQETGSKANQEPITNNHNPIEEQTTCAAAPAAVVEVAPALAAKPAEPAEPPAYTLPTNTGEECPIARQRVEEFVELYPGVDVMQELRKMRGWLISNPAKRKTKKGMMSFVNNWLSKQQNAAGSQQQIRRIGPGSGRPSINDIGVAPGADNDIFKQMRTEL